MSTVLEVKNLNVETTGKLPHSILKNVNFQVQSGDTLAIVGESGSGKSMTVLSILGLLPVTGVRITSGEILLEDKDLVGYSDDKMNAIRGKEIATIFQEPMTSLNPSFTVGNQLAEVFRYHTNYNRKDVKKRSIELLKKVKIPDPEEKLKAYPHELSGGMRQRIMIAIALACNPKLLLADEPTTALDVTIQAQVLDILTDLKNEFGMTMVIITHDLAVVAENCNKVIVMYAGQIVEMGSVEEIFQKPKHPYTQGLIQSIPGIGKPKERLHTIRGNVPDINQMPKGCRFHPRCEIATEKCIKQEPILESIESGRRVRCWHTL
ncbi:ABC transporter ATP-binding protein [Oceanobacillus halophilus]|uniref:ABC transporter ATP-binding protein n=1 Tax=Oceanobacillus halophilus TaxID=930130 RepID=A0A495A7I7_9BACI|nr:ABC transporter ATP-binding protein [Oceanobacillus halophilus]RKQ35718.1 ABC transporter ATP-binding protein [Oceanobacillus halophilus]